MIKHIQICENIVCYNGIKTRAMDAKLFLPISLLHKSNIIRGLKYHKYI